MRNRRRKKVMVGREKRMRIEVQEVEVGEKEKD